MPGVLLFLFCISSHKRQQECIPVGCVPSAAVAAGGGSGAVYLSMHWTVGRLYPSMHWAGGVSQHALGRGSLGLVSAQVGVYPGASVQCMLGYTPPLQTK